MMKIASIIVMAIIFAYITFFLMILNQKYDAQQDFMKKIAEKANTESHFTSIMFNPQKNNFEVSIYNGNDIFKNIPECKEFVANRQNIDDILSTFYIDLVCYLHEYLPVRVETGRIYHGIYSLLPYMYADVIDYVTIPFGETKQNIIVSLNNIEIEIKHSMCTLTIKSPILKKHDQTGECAILYNVPRNIATYNAP